MRRVSLVVFALLFARNAAKACSVASYERDSILTNEQVLSSNGRYLVIERWFEQLKDFESARADAFMNFDPPPDSDDPPAENEARKTITFAVYEANTRKRLSEFAIPVLDDGHPLVSDSGYVAIVRQLQSFCYISTIDPAQAFVTILRSDGTVVARLTAADVLTMSDIKYDERLNVSSRIEGEDREILVLTIGTQDRHIDLASGKMLDPKENILPAPAVWADTAPRDRAYPSGPFDDSAAVHLTSKELLALARDEPLPDYPIVAHKAHVDGPVWVEVLVSEYGEVLAARSTQGFFGLAPAALGAVRQWRFRPLQVNGKHVKYAGEVAIHFGRRVP